MAVVAEDPRLIIQVPRGSGVEQRLRSSMPRSEAGGEVVVESAPADGAGVLDPPAAGEVVMSILSPEALVREAAELQRVIARAGTGSDPLVVVIEAAEELRDDELASVVEAARHTERAVILRICATPDDPAPRRCELRERVAPV